MTLESRAAPIEIPEKTIASVSHQCVPKTHTRFVRGKARSSSLQWTSAFGGISEMRRPRCVAVDPAATVCQPPGPSVMT
jgi:hypothetical protein